MKITDRICVVLYLAVAALPFVALKLGWRDHPIFGSLPAARYPKASLAAVRSEEFQRGYTTWFESRLGLKGYQVAADNTLLYHALRDTRWGSQVMLGADGTLFKDEDIAYYNKAGALLPDAARVAAMADKIAALQARLRSQHRAFVPLLIPSKTTLYREKVPALWARELGQPRPSDDRIYLAMKHALDARKVAYVDARAMFMSGQISRDLLWSTDARHWSIYGACLAMREVTSLYVQLTGAPGLDYDCQVTRVPQPETNDDYDLWRLLNVWGLPRRPHRVPVVSHREPAAGAAKPSLMLIGTSFQWQLLRDAGNSHRFGKMFMNYYDRLFVEWPKDVHTTVDRRSDSWRAAMLDNDLYILDLFEVYLLAPDTYVDEVLADLEPEVADDVEAPSSGAAITGMHDLGVTDGSHYFELWGTFPAGPASYTASVTCDGVRRPATVYYANPNAQQLNVQISDPGPGTCDHQAPPRASGVSCTFRVRRGQIGSPSFGPRKVCPAPQGETGQDPDGRCQLSFPGC